MIYVVTLARDGREYTSQLVSYDGIGSAKELAGILAQTENADLVSVKEKDMGETQQQDPLERESQKPDAQDKTAGQRVEKQEINTKEVAPNKRGDVRPKE